MRGIKDAKRRRDRRKKNRPVLVLTGVLCVLCLILVGVFNFKHSPAVPKTKTVKKTKEAPKSKVAPPLNIEITTKKKKNTNTLTISAVGDCTLGTDVSFNRSTSLNAYYDTQGAAYFFQNVRPILEKDDLTIVNMEGTLTEENARENKTFAFKGPPEYASILSEGSVEIANLANNHSTDYGQKSYTDTISALDNVNIPSFGKDRTLLLDVNNIKVGVTGIYELADHLGRKKQLEENIAALKQAGAQLVIVNFHWGMEKEYTPNDTQKTLAHLAIDEGADLVIGHHPHVLQGIEKYKDKYIAYSLGNFCFGGNSNPGDKDTIIFQQTFTFDEDTVTKDDNINIIPCSISSSSGKNDYRPTPLEGSEKQRVLDKVKKNSEGL